MQATNSVEAEAEPDVDPDVDPDPEQYPPLFFFKSTYWPSGISSIWKNIYIVSKLYWVFTHLNLNSARVRNNPKGVAGSQCKTAWLAEHVILTPWREMIVWSYTMDMMRVKHPDIFRAMVVKLMLLFHAFPPRQLMLMKMIFTFSCFAIETLRLPLPFLALAECDPLAARKFISIRFSSITMIFNEVIAVVLHHDLYTNPPCSPESWCPMDGFQAWSKATYCLPQSKMLDKEPIWWGRWLRKWKKNQQSWEEKTFLFEFTLPKWKINIGENFVKHICWW